MRLHIAGLEGCSSYKNVQEYIKENIDSILWLSSFYYIRKQDRMKGLIRVCNKDNFLLDSGAFTFRFHGLKGMDIDTYTTEYIKFIKEYDIKYFFEMDIDHDEESFKKVLELRKRIETETGKKCIPVWHDTRGIEEWIDLINNYDYVAIGGITSTDGKKQEIVKKLISMANKKNIKVHLLGYNRCDLLDYDAYSCDATSWNGGRYGGLWTWDAKTQRPKKQNRRLDRRVESSRQKELYLHNLKVWMYYQKVLRYKGFWRG